MSAQQINANNFYEKAITVILFGTLVAASTAFVVLWQVGDRSSLHRWWQTAKTFVQDELLPATTTAPMAEDPSEGLPSTPFTREFEQVDHYLEQQQPELAAKLLKGNLAQDQQHLKTLFRLAYCYQTMGRHQQALDTIDQFIQIKSDYQAAYLLRALINHYLANWAAVLTDVDNILEQDPEQVRALVLKGKYYHARGEFDQALSYYRQALEYHRQYAEAYTSIGKVYHYQQNYQRALVNYDYALKLDKHNFGARLNRAAIYIEQQKPQEALSDLDQAKSDYPYSPEVYILRGNLFNLLQQYKRAIKNFNSALQLSSEQVPTLLGRGQAYFSLGQVRSALDDLNAVIRQDPRAAAAYHYRSMALLILRNYQAALSDCNTLITQNQAEAATFFYKAQCLQALNRRQEAVKNYHLFLETESIKDPRLLELARQALKQLN